MTGLTASIQTGVPDERERAGELRFDLRELSGSLGDLGTFLPLAVAMSLTCGMDIGLVFIFAGLMNVVTGLLFRQPVPVQPMKAIAVVAIAEGLSPGAIASAGMLTGVAVFALAVTGGIDWIVRAIPKPVIRGIQVGVGLKLAWKGVVFIYALPAVGWDSWVAAIILGAIVALLAGRRQPILMYLFVAGFGVLWLCEPAAYAQIGFNLPVFHIVQPAAGQWWVGLTRGAIPQLPLTLLNSVIAVCALSEDYFPGRGVKPRKMATSVALMNLVCVPFGGMPMCHGAGGLAAQYRFGARTGGSVVMLGVLKIIAGLLFGGVLILTLQQYPTSILAVMIIAAGVTLAMAGRDSLRGGPFIIVGSMAVAIILANALVGFAIGCAVAAVLTIARRSQVKHGDPPAFGSSAGGSAVGRSR